MPARSHNSCRVVSRVVTIFFIALGLSILYSKDTLVNGNDTKLIMGGNLFCNGCFDLLLASLSW